MLWYSNASIIFGTLDVTGYNYNCGLCLGSGLVIHLISVLFVILCSHQQKYSTLLKLTKTQIPSQIIKCSRYIWSMRAILMIWAWASYQIRKISGCACAVNAGNVFPRHRFQRKPLVIDPDMHHGTCVKHVPWCMSGSITNDGGENVPSIPGACATRNFAYLVRGPWSQRLSWNSYCWNRRHHLIMDSSHCRCGHHQRLFHSLIPLSTLFIRSSYWLEWYSELYTSQLNNWFIILCCWSSQCVIWYSHYPMLPFQFIKFVHVNTRWHLLLMSVWHFIKGEVFVLSVVMMK